MHYCNFIIVIDFDVVVIEEEVDIEDEFFSEPSFQNYKVEASPTPDVDIKDYKIRLRRRSSTSNENAEHNVTIRKIPPTKRPYKGNREPFIITYNNVNTFETWNTKNLTGVLYGCPFCKFCNKYTYNVYAHIRQKHESNEIRCCKFYV